MKVIDKDAHEVSIKEANIWTFVWIGLSLLFAIFLFYHGDLVHDIQNIGDLQRIVNEYAPSLQINTDDYTGSLQTYREYMTISYISGYLIEKTVHEILRESMI
jgi:tellurite resistance protein TerC